MPLSCQTVTLANRVSYRYLVGLGTLASSDVSAWPGISQQELEEPHKVSPLKRSSTIFISIGATSCKRFQIEPVNVPLQDVVRAVIRPSPGILSSALSSLYVILLQLHSLADASVQRVES